MSTPRTWPEFFAGLNAAVAQAPEAQLRRARALIERSFAEPVNLDAMARAAALSRFHFARRFRRTYGVTPHQYLTERRLRAARILLEETDLPVTEICLEVGFASLGSFSRLFARHVGRSPQSYRRALVQVPEMPAPPVPGCFLWAYRRG